MKSDNLIDGKSIAAQIREEAKQEVERRLALDRRPSGLAIILVGENPASQTYVNMKEIACQEVGIKSLILRLPRDTDQATLMRKVEEINSDANYHGFLVQSPLPDGLDEEEVNRSIDPLKDVDGFHPYNVGLLAMGQPRFVGCTPLGVMELLRRYKVDPNGQHAVVIGRSHIVGMPLALLLACKSAGANATVTLCHSRTRNLAEIACQADILIAALGHPNFVTSDMVKEGAVVIDVGISRLEDASSKRGYRLCGDVDFDEVRKKASLITPVPGGVGPMTVAMLLKNTLLAEELQNKKRLFK